MIRYVNVTSFAIVPCRCHTPWRLSATTPHFSPQEYALLDTSGSKTPHALACLWAGRQGIIEVICLGIMLSLLSFTACNRDSKMPRGQETSSKTSTAPSADLPLPPLTTLHHQQHVNIERVLNTVAQSAAAYIDAFPNLGSFWPRDPTLLYYSGLSRSTRLVRDESSRIQLDGVVVRPGNTHLDKRTRRDRITLYWAPYCCRQHACVLRASGQIEWITIVRLKEERELERLRFVQELKSCSVGEAP